MVVYITKFIRNIIETDNEIPKRIGVISDKSIGDNLIGLIVTWEEINS